MHFFCFVTPKKGQFSYIYSCSGDENNNKHLLHFNNSNVSYYHLNNSNARRGMKPKVSLLNVSLATTQYPLSAM